MVPVIHDNYDKAASNKKEGSARGGWRWFVTNISDKRWRCVDERCKKKPRRILWSLLSFGCEAVNAAPAASGMDLGVAAAARRLLKQSITMLQISWCTNFLVPAKPPQMVASEVLGRPAGGSRWIFTEVQQLRDEGDPIGAQSELENRHAQLTALVVSGQSSRRQAPRFLERFRCRQQWRQLGMAGALRCNK